MIRKVDAEKINLSFRADLRNEQKIDKGKNFDLKLEDSVAKRLFGNNVLCAQFLSCFSGIPEFSGVKPEDIEDVTERFLPMFTTAREADVVKSVRIIGLQKRWERSQKVKAALGEKQETGEFGVFVILEHKSAPAADISFQLLTYIWGVLDGYRRDMLAKGFNPQTRGFRYPVVIPIVYYTGDEKWSVPGSNRERFFLKRELGRYIPGFEYLLFEAGKIPREKILGAKNEFAFISLLAGIGESAESTEIFNQLPPDFFEGMKDSSEAVKEDMLQVIGARLRRLKMPEEKIRKILQEYWKEVDQSMDKLYTKLNWDLSDYGDWEGMREKYAKLEKASAEKDEVIMRQREENLRQGEHISRLMQQLKAHGLVPVM